MLDGMRHIRAFLAVARLGNFTRAANELHISQPAITIQIKQLEEWLRVRLFERDNRRVELTRRGYELLIPLERVLLDVEAVAGITRDLTTLDGGLVTVGAIPSLAAKLLPPAIAQFAECYPDISVRVRDVMAASIVELVKGGEVDFAIGSQLRDDQDILSQHLFTEPIYAFIPHAHPLSKRRVLELAELSEHKIIVTAKDTSIRSILDRALEQQRLVLHISHETNHMSTAIAMVNARLGIGVLPLAAITCGSCENIRHIRITNPTLDRRVSIISRAGRPLSKASEKLIEILHQEAAGYNVHTVHTLKRQGLRRRKKLGNLTQPRTRVLQSNGDKRDLPSRT
jgi:LysR family carnitine catabolism transcriptional activator